MSVPIQNIRLDGGTQSRALINDATVAEYAEAMADPATVFPPVVVYFDGKDYWLADGFHRLAACQQVGRVEIPADVRQGDRRRAILHSVAANSAHGLRRTNDDKRRAVMTLLEDAEWSQWSDREIARQCAVSHEFVSRIRRSLSTVDGETGAKDRIYTTKHGTTASMNTANIGGGKAESPPIAQENKADPAADEGVDSGTPQPEKGLSAPPPQIDGGPEADAEPLADEPEEEPELIDPRVKAVMRKHSGLTREALLRDYAELVVASKKERSAAKSEIARLKESLGNHTGDQDEVIRRLEKTITHKNSEMYRVNLNFEAEKKKNFALSKRIKELEAMGIVLNP